MKRLLLIGVLLGAAVACGGGGGGTGAPRNPVIGQNAADRTAALTIVVPGTGSASVAKRPEVIAPGTQSVRVLVYTVNGATPSPEPPATVAQISATATGCSTTSNGLSCTIDVAVPVSAAVVLEILSYSSTDASGTPIGQGFVGPINTTVAITTPVGVSLGGYVASITIGAVTPQTPSGSTQTLTFTVAAKDGNGNLIVPPGTYGTPITISASGDPNGALSFSPSSLASPPANGTSTVTISYDTSKSLSGSPTVNVTSGTVTTGFSLGSGSGTLTAGYRVIEYSVPTSNSHPWGIASDPSDKSLWFSENGSSKVGKLFTATCTQTTTPSCTIIEGALGQAIAPTGITKGQDGNIWVGGNATVANNHVLVLEPSSACSGVGSSSITCSEVPQPDPYTSPGPTVGDVRTGGDGLIHAAMGMGTPSSGYIVAYYPISLPATEYDVCCSNFAQPFGLTTNNWFTDSGSNLVGSFSCTEGCGYYEYPFQASGIPMGIVAGPDGNLYVADQGNNSIVEFSPSNCTSNGTACSTYTNIPLPAGSLPVFLTIGPDGNVWFTESGTSKIGILNISTHAITQIAIPTAAAQPWDITLGPDGNVWFTEMSGNKIGVIVP